ncbi:MAG: hypothetical protein A2Z45_07740 [Chloroflexi bacterium RBG_19FT_COMBO_55_16]|nr:MAG: hypothetical protein A2Z45_07740 [Chloroflexi bacterium RBG_19FT_COMBO_55_16]
MFRKSVKKHHINPKFRAYGKARIDIAMRATSQAEWQKLWKKPAFPFPFSWGDNWKQCMEYKVDDFPAEVGFFIDILGLPINAFDPGYAMFTSPNGEFYFAVIPTLEGEQSTPPDSIRIQFMVEDIYQTASELERRGIQFEHWPQACSTGSSLFIGYFRTPHGICVDLWGLVVLEESSLMESSDGEGSEPEQIGQNNLNLSQSLSTEFEKDQPIENADVVEDFEDESEEDPAEEDEAIEYQYISEENA